MTCHFCCFSYVYIPLLPLGLLEVLNTPTPFIAGVHTDLLPNAAELVSCIHTALMLLIVLCAFVHYIWHLELNYLLCDFKFYA